MPRTGVLAGSNISSKSLPQLRRGVVHVWKITLQDRVGIDVERLRPVEDIDGLAAMCFSAPELEAFDGVAQDRKVEAFFNCWTRKESFVKAVGEGLSYPLKEFDVTLRPGESARLLSLEGSAGLGRSWSIVDLRPLAGWTGAVAVERSDAEVEVLGWR
jgi:4'-phosphopantetheinyl transferase